MARGGKLRPKLDPDFTLYFLPRSYGTTFAASKNYDRQGTAWSHCLKCPHCGKRHDPKNRLPQLGFQADGYWKVDVC